MEPRDDAIPGISTLQKRYLLNAKMPFPHMQMSLQINWLKASVLCLDLASTVMYRCKPWSVRNRISKSRSSNFYAPAPGKGGGAAVGFNSLPSSLLKTHKHSIDTK